MVELIGNVGPDVVDLHRWAQNEPVSEVLRTAYSPGRLERWYGLGIDVVKNTLIRGVKDPRVEMLGNYFFPTWNSAILFKYSPGIGIALHCDPPCFSAWGVIVNIGAATFVEHGGDSERLTRFEDGAIYRFRTDIPHGVHEVSDTRYSLLFRRIKPEYLNLEFDQLLETAMAGPTNDEGA